MRKTPMIPGLLTPPWSSIPGVIWQPSTQDPPFDVVIPNGPVNRESERICPGDEIVTVDTGEVGRLGLSICYDMRFAEMYRIMALEGAQILLMPADFTMPTGKDHWETILRTRAIETAVM